MLSSYQNLEAQLHPQVAARNFRTVAALDPQLYSRWGELVFQSENPGTQWNGIYNGQYAPAGVYLYQLEMTTCDGPLKTTGNLTLIR